MGVGGGSQPSFFGSFSSGGGADGSYAAWPGEYAPAEGVESAPKLLGEDDACPAPSKLVGEYCVGGRRVRFRSAARETSPEQQLVAPSVLSRSDRQTIGEGKPCSDAAARRRRRRAVGRAPVWQGTVIARQSIVVGRPGAKHGGPRSSDPRSAPRTARGGSDDQQWPWRNGRGRRLGHRLGHWFLRPLRRSSGFIIRHRNTCVGEYCVETRWVSCGTDKEA